MSPVPRHPKGVPSGGRFAGHDHAESDVSLGDSERLVGEPLRGDDYEFASINRIVDVLRWSAGDAKITEDKLLEAFQTAGYLDARDAWFARRTTEMSPYMCSGCGRTADRHRFAECDGAKWVDSRPPVPPRSVDHERFAEQVRALFLDAESVDFLWPGHGSDPTIKAVVWASGALRFRTAGVRDPLDAEFTELDRVLKRIVDSGSMFDTNDGTFFRIGVVGPPGPPLR